MKFTDVQVYKKETVDFVVSLSLEDEVLVRVSFPTKELADEYQRFKKLQSMTPIQATLATVFEGLRAEDEEGDILDGGDPASAFDASEHEMSVRLFRTPLGRLERAEVTRLTKSITNTLKKQKNSSLYKQIKRMDALLTDRPPRKRTARISQ